MAEPQQFVSLLVIETKHGEDINIYSTPDKAKTALVAYVDHWWDNEMDDQVRPANDDEAIEAYFERTNERGEDYTLLLHTPVL